MNTFGLLFRITTFGESHGPALGVVVDGCPAGVRLEAEWIQSALDRRRPGQSPLTTSRQEQDRVELLSGVYEGKSLGTPIAAIVRNTDARSRDYNLLKSTARPGHADKVWRARFLHRDHRGGGRTSGRETIGRVIGGAIAEAFLARDAPSIRTIAWVSRIGEREAAPPNPGLTRSEVDSHPTRCPDPTVREEMSREIVAVKEAGDTLGGAIDLRVEGLPVGLGEPVFGKLSASLAGAMAGIGTVVGVSLGPAGLTSLLGCRGASFHACLEHHGGIQGGMANGGPVALRVTFKPPGTLGEHARSGRHDPCILPRAVPVVEAMASLVIADLLLQFGSRRHCE